MFCDFSVLKCQNGAVAFLTGYRSFLYVFDILADAGESYLNMKAIDRFLRVSDYEKKYSGSFIDWAEYKNGKELWFIILIL